MDEPERGAFFYLFPVLFSIFQECQNPAVTDLSGFAAQFVTIPTVSNFIMDMEQSVDAIHPLLPIEPGPYVLIPFKRCNLLSSLL